ncbi:EF-hand domain-containing protein [Pseudoscourfieldia marina]
MASMKNLKNNSNNSDDDNLVDEHGDAHALYSLTHDDVSKNFAKAQDVDEEDVQQQVKIPPSGFLLSHLPCEISRALQPLDLDGDGVISLAEVRSFAQTYAKTKQANGYLRSTIVLMGIMLLLFVALSAAVTFVVVDQVQNLDVGSDGAVVSRSDGGSVAVRTFRADVPLNQLHRADVNYLSNLRVVSVDTAPNDDRNQPLDDEDRIYKTTHIVQVNGITLRTPRRDDENLEDSTGGGNYGWSPIVTVHGARGEMIEVSAGGIFAKIPADESDGDDENNNSNNISLEEEVLLGESPEEEEFLSSGAADGGSRHHRRRNLRFVASSATGVGGGGTGLNVQYNPTVDPSTGQPLRMGYNSETVCSSGGGFFNDGGFGTVRDGRFGRRRGGCVTGAPRGVVVGESSLAQARDERARQVEASVAAAPNVAVSAVDPLPAARVIYGVPRGSESAIGGGGGGGVETAAIMPATGNRAADAAHSARRAQQQASLG